MTEKNDTVELAAKLQEAFSSAGMKDGGGRAIVKYSFLSKKQVRKIKSMRILPMGDGRNMYVRIF